MQLTDFTDNGPHIRASFIPFAVMTRRQQAEHLALAHGMGADYWANTTGDREGDLPNDSAAIDWYLTSPFFSHVRSLIRLHEEDHDLLGASHHLHTKLTQPARPKEWN